MTDIARLNKLFFDRTGMQPGKIESIVGDALHGADDGELFLEYRQSESFSFDDGKLKAASFDTSQGFGLRAISGEATGYGHASELSEDAIRRASSTVKAVRAGASGQMETAPIATNQQLYVDDNPLQGTPFEKKIELLQNIDAYARAKDPRVRQVMASLTGNWQAIEIIRKNIKRKPNRI